jgi:TIR domain
MIESMPAQIFISYSSADKNIADAVCAGLEQARLRCWIAPRDIIAGDVYGEAILDAISACRVIVVIFSAKADLSGQVLREVERAVGAGKVVIPFRIEDVKPSKAMEFFLSASHWLDAFSPPIERHIVALSDQLETLLQRKPGAQRTARSSSTISSASPDSYASNRGQTSWNQSFQAERWSRMLLVLVSIGVTAVGAWFVLTIGFREKGFGDHGTQFSERLVSDNPYLPLSPSDFAGIKIAQEHSGWEDCSDRLSELRNLFERDDEEATRSRRFYVYDKLKSAELFFWLPFSEEEPTFDVTFVNNTGADLTITGAGVALDSGDEHRYSAGEPEPAPVPVVTRVVIDIPPHMKPAPEYSPFGFPSEHNQPLDTPQFLSPGSAFRYTVRLRHYVENLPTAVMLRLSLKTSRGTAYSKRIYLQG